MENVIPACPIVTSRFDSFDARVRRLTGYSYSEHTAKARRTAAGWGISPEQRVDLASCRTAGFGGHVSDEFGAHSGIQIPGRVECRLQPAVLERYRRGD